MNGLLSRIRYKILVLPSFEKVISFGVFTTCLAIALFGYLGSFSRYGSDDYCLSAFYLQKGNLFTQLIQRYLHSSSRYTNILFIGLVDKLFGWYNVAILPPLMLILFVFGLYLLLKEIVQVTSLGWSRLMTLFMASLVVYFSVGQAPNLYETLYWRAGMTSHFAPLVFMTFLGTFILKQIRSAGERSPSLWVLVICFIASFVIGGFSEPPVALMITLLVLAIFSVWLFGDSRSRRSNLAILFWSLAGSLLALVVLILAPANAIRLGTSSPGLLELISKTLQYPSLFIVDVFRSLPVPTLVSIILPGVLFYGQNFYPPQAYSRKTRDRVVFLVVAVIFLAYLLIASSFAPSVYGQSYPVARARFAGRVILTCALMMDGALIGILIANTRTKFFQSTNLLRFAIVVLLFLSSYPLRTVSLLSMEVPVYQQRALAWDLRDAEIRALKADGIRDVIVPFLSAEVSQDLGDRREFRLNRCAAVIYGVDSILALPMDEE